MMKTLWIDPNDIADVWTVNNRKENPSSLERACIETRCVKSSVIKRETSEFAVDRPSCNFTRHIDSKINAKHLK